MIAYLTIGIALEGGESGELDAEVGGGGAFEQNQWKPQDNGPVLLKIIFLDTSDLRVKLSVFGCRWSGGI